MSNQLPPWDARSRSVRYAEPVARALEIETGRPFRRLRVKHKIFLTIMKRLIDFFKDNFLVRRITSVVIGAVTAINLAKVAPEITAEQTETVIVVLSAGVTFLFECLQKWLRLKFVKPTAPVLGLLLLAGMSLTSLPGCRSAGVEEGSPYEASGEQAYWEGEKARAIREIYGPGNYQAATREADEAEIAGRLLSDGE